MHAFNWWLLNAQMWKEWAGRASYDCVAKAQLLHNYGYGGLEHPVVWELSSQKSTGVVSHRHAVGKLSPSSGVCLCAGGCMPRRVATGTTRGMGRLREGREESLYICI